MVNDQSLLMSCGSAIAKAINSKIFCSDHKMKLLQCIDEDPELQRMLTRDPLDAQVHVTGLFAINRDNLGEYLDSFKGHFTKIVSEVTAPLHPKDSQGSTDWPKTNRLDVQRSCQQDQAPSRASSHCQSDAQELQSCLLVSSKRLDRPAASVRRAVF